MEDAFSLFGLERRPLVDEAALKESYLRLAGARHPDLSGGNDEKFHQLQGAYKILREPGLRLRHLMELEFPGSGSPSGSEPPHAELFLRAGGAIQAAKAALLRLENSSSALTRALLSPEVAAALRQVREASESMRQTREELEGRLEDLDRRWPGVSAVDLSALATSFAFLSRWASQLSEWEFRLENG
jgi:curved DNA-binding protein CbpA